MTRVMGGQTLALLFVVAWLGLSGSLAILATRRLWKTSAGGKRLYLLAGWSLITIGAMQLAFTPLRFESFEEAALWFATAGLAVILTGAINLLNLERQAGDAALRRTCVAANAAITAIFAAIATHRGAEPPHDLVSVALLLVSLFATFAARGSGAGLLPRPPPNVNPSPPPPPRRRRCGR